jgi:hypothetical protein
MTMRKSVLAAVAAVSMIGVSGGALAAPSAAPLSVASANVRAGADMEDANDYRGGYIIPGLILVVIGVLVYVLTKNDEPTSP